MTDPWKEHLHPQWVIRNSVTGEYLHVPAGSVWKGHWQPDKRIAAWVWSEGLARWTMERLGMADEPWELEPW